MQDPLVKVNQTKKSKSCIFQSNVSTIDFPFSCVCTLKGSVPQHLNILILLKVWNNGGSGFISTLV